MSGDREARAMGAGEKIEVEGEEYTLRPVVIQYLCELEREALRHYKRQFLETFSENADLLGDKAHEVLVEKIREASGFTADNLPQVKVYDAAKVKINDETRSWVEDQYGVVPSKDEAIREILTNALNERMISPSELQEMSGYAPRRGSVRYDQWWVSGTQQGRLALLLCSLKAEHPNITTKQIEKWPFQKVLEASKIIEHITMASVGNM